MKKKYQKIIKMFIDSFDILYKNHDKNIMNEITNLIFKNKSFKGIQINNIINSFILYSILDDDTELYKFKIRNTIWGAPAFISIDTNYNITYGIIDVGHQHPTISYKSFFTELYKYDLKTLEKDLEYLLFKYII